MRQLQNRQRPSEWNSLAAVREATAGALQALAVMACFVLFGLGWAALADASQSARLKQAGSPTGSNTGRFASDSLTRYRTEPHNSPTVHREPQRGEVRHAHFERQTNRRYPGSPGNSEGNSGNSEERCRR